MGDVENERTAASGWYRRKVADFRERDRSPNIPVEASKPSGERGLENQHRSHSVRAHSQHAHCTLPFPSSASGPLSVAGRGAQRSGRTAPNGEEKEPPPEK